eukprot:GEMP01085985.1.p1 GENE.GEMP01085985.1~~GEMP01085985.1.p1  ORF type:complete len:293 (+),score=49.46 GEMP01085985.1:67-945(+)
MAATLQYCLLQNLAGQEVYIDPLIVEAKFSNQVQLQASFYPDHNDRLATPLIGGRQLSRRSFFNCLGKESDGIPDVPHVSQGALVQYCHEEVRRILDDLLWADDEVFHKVTRPLFVNNIPHRIHAELFLFRMKRPRISGLRHRLHQALSILQNTLYPTEATSATRIASEGVSEVAVFSALAVVFFIDRICPLRLEAFSTLRRFCRDFNAMAEMCPASIFADDSMHETLERPFWAAWWNLDHWEPREAARKAPLVPLWQRAAFGVCVLGMAAVCIVTGNVPRRKASCGTGSDS